ncbi:MAG: hypothetical protein AAB897_02525 [Patescibacteria group bacterium]
MDQRISPQNLIKQVSPQAVQLQPKFYKQLVFDFFSVAAAGVLGYLYREYLSGGLSLVTLLGGLALFAIISTLQVFFTKDLRRRLFVMILETIAILLSFWGHNWKLLGTAALVLLVFRFWGEILGKRELESSLEIRFFTTARPVLSKFTTALIVAFIVLYVPFWSPEKVFVSQGTFDGFVNWFSNVVGGFYPSIRLNTTFGEFVNGLAKSQLQSESAFTSLSPGAQEQALNQTASQVAASLSKGLGIEVDLNAPVSGTFYQYIINLLRDWHARFGNAFVAAWAISIFFVFRGFGAIFYWLAGIFAFIIYQILLASGFIHVIGETRTHEVIDW